MANAGDDIKKPSSSSSSPTEHLFWRTQPVMQLSDSPSLADGPILPCNPLLNLKLNPHTLPPPFEWASFDAEDDDDFSILHRFISSNYTTTPFTFSHSPLFLRWLLLPPTHLKSLHLSIRIKNTNKLVAFIAALPFTLRINTHTLPIASAHLLCVHRKLRSKNLAPVLIRELVRRSQFEDIWQGLYATESLLSSPFCSTQWLELPLNPKKLETDERIRKLPRETETIGFRKMKPQDAAAVADLLRNQLKKFMVALEVDEHFVRHFVVPKQGVVESYVVEDLETDMVTDFCSFVIREMVVKKNVKRSKIRCGVLFYYAACKTPVLKMMKDLLVMAKREGCDLFMAQGVMGNDAFLDDLMFRATGDGKKMNYYLYNYRLGKELMPQGLGLIVL